MAETNRALSAEPLTAAAFSPFGDVIETEGSHYPINDGMCDRYHDLARLDFAGDGARAGISVGFGRPYPLPYVFSLVERHPFGSQAFVPMTEDPFLVIVAPDEDGQPGPARAFLTRTGQGVNYLRNTWHGVLVPLVRPSRFLIVDRIGPPGNLEEFRYEHPWTVTVD